ncbi:microfibril-associated glycoprotein 4-like [Mytilus edulis]|uniref:microfibril-associated glycoprotein 4-like n=1 Tax=Mytilus edulis TaxID=6550 RepID=UPI0039F01154
MTPGAFLWNPNTKAEVNAVRDKFSLPANACLWVGGKKDSNGKFVFEIDDTGFVLDQQAIPYGVNGAVLDTTGFFIDPNGECLGINPLSFNEITFWTWGPQACYFAATYVCEFPRLHQLFHVLYVLVTKPKDCGDIDPAHCKSGVYTIYPVGTRPFDVYCKLINQGKAWTVIQRRFNGKINFNRTWKDYEYGFGTINGEHWLGNDKIHILTSKGDCLYQHNDKHFSTPVEDNDTHKGGNCADYSKAGFWFHKCTQSNLNGPYLKGETKTRKPGMTWPCWRGELCCLKTTTFNDT